jgi:hypothetical protein
MSTENNNKYKDEITEFTGKLFSRINLCQKEKEEEKRKKKKEEEVKDCLKEIDNWNCDKFKKEEEKDKEYNIYKICNFENTPENNEKYTINGFAPDYQFFMKYMEACFNNR